MGKIYFKRYIGHNILYFLAFNLIDIIKNKAKINIKKDRYVISIT